MADSHTDPAEKLPRSQEGTDVSPTDATPVIRKGRSKSPHHHRHRTKALDAHRSGAARHHHKHPCHKHGHSPTRKHTSPTTTLDGLLTNKKHPKAKRRGSAKTETGPSSSPAVSKKQRLRRHSDTVHGSTKADATTSFDWSAFLLEDSTRNIKDTETTKGTLQKEAQKQTNNNRLLHEHLEKGKAQQRDSEEGTVGTLATAARAATSALNLLHCEDPPTANKELIGTYEDGTTNLGADTTSIAETQTTAHSHRRHVRSRSPRRHASTEEGASMPSTTTASEQMERRNRRIEQRQRLKEQKRRLEQQRIQKLETDLQQHKQERLTIQPAEAPVQSKPHGPGAAIANAFRTGATKLGVATTPKHRHTTIAAKDRQEHRDSVTKASEQDNATFTTALTTTVSSSSSPKARAKAKEVFKGFHKKKDESDTIEETELGRHATTGGMHLRSRFSAMIHRPKEQDDDMEESVLTADAATVQTAPAQLPSGRESMVRTTHILGGQFTPTPTPRPTKGESTLDLPPKTQVDTAPAASTGRTSPPRKRSASSSPPPSWKRGQTSGHGKATSPSPPPPLERGHTTGPTKTNQVPTTTVLSRRTTTPLPQNKGASPTRGHSPRRQKMRLFKKRHSKSATNMTGIQERRKRLTGLWCGYNSRSLTDVLEHGKDHHDDDDDDSIPSFLETKADPPVHRSSGREALLDQFMDKTKAPRVSDLVSEEASLTKKHRQWRHLQHVQEKRVEDQKQLEKSVSKPTHPPSMLCFDDSQATIITKNLLEQTPPSTQGETKTTLSPTKAVRLALPTIRTQFPNAERFAGRRTSTIKPGVDTADFNTERFSINSESFGVTPQAYLQMVMDGLAAPSVPVEKGYQSPSSATKGETRNIKRKGSLLSAMSSHSEQFFDANEDYLDEDDDATLTDLSFHTAKLRASSATLEDFSPDLVQKVQEDFFTQFEQLDSQEQDNLLKKIRSVSVLHPPQFQWTGSEAGEMSATENEIMRDASEQSNQTTSGPQYDAKEPPSHIDELLSKIDEVGSKNTKPGRRTARRRSQSVEEPSRRRGSKHKSLESLIERIHAGESAGNASVSQRTPRRLISVDATETAANLSMPAPPQKHQEPRSLRGRKEDSFSKGLRLWQRKGTAILDSSSHSHSISTFEEDDISLCPHRRRSRSLTDIEVLESLAHDIEVLEALEKGQEDMELAAHWSGHAADQAKTSLPSSLHGNKQQTSTIKEDCRLPTLPSNDVPIAVEMPQYFAGARRVSSIAELDDSIVSMSAHWRARHQPETFEPSPRLSTTEADEINEDDDRPFLFESIGSLPSQLFDDNRNLLPQEPRKDDTQQHSQGAAQSEEKEGPADIPPVESRIVSRPGDVEGSDDQTASLDRVTPINDPPDIVHDLEPPPDENVSLEHQLQPETTPQPERSNPSYEFELQRVEEPLNHSMPNEAAHVPPQDAIVDRPDARYTTQDAPATDEDQPSYASDYESADCEHKEVSTAKPSFARQQVVEQDNDQGGYFSKVSDYETSDAEFAREPAKADVLQSKSEPPRHAGYFSQPSDYDISDVEVTRKRESRRNSDDPDVYYAEDQERGKSGRNTKAAPEERKSSNPGIFEEDEGLFESEFAVQDPYRRRTSRHEYDYDYELEEDVYENPRYRRPSAAVARQKRHPSEYKRRQSRNKERYSARYYEDDAFQARDYTDGYSAYDDEDIINPCPSYREPKWRPRRSTPPDMSYGDRRVSRRDVERDRRMSSRSVAHQRASRRDRRSTRQYVHRPSSRGVYEYNGGLRASSRPSGYDRRSVVEDSYDDRYDEHGFQDSYYDVGRENRGRSKKRELKEYRPSHVGRSVVVVKDSGEDLEGSKSSLVDSKSSCLEEEVPDQMYKEEPLHLLKEDPPFKQGEQRRRLSSTSTTSRLASSRSLMEGISTTASLSDFESGHKQFRKSELDKGVHGKPKRRRKKNWNREDRPLYHRPNLQEEARERRRRDFTIMGGIPSFYDDHLYASFDYLDLEPNYYPRLTKDGEYDDYALEAQLKFRQWEGMPKIRTESDSEDDDYGRTNCGGNRQEDASGAPYWR